MEFTLFIDQILAVLTVVSQIAIIVFLVMFLWSKSDGIMMRWIGKNSLLFAFGIALLSTLFSLFYSEIAGYEPCKLCWFQRILMYPQVLLLGMALLKKDRGIVDYIIPLSAIGALLAGYHSLLQIGLVPEAICDASSYSVSCAKLFVMQFGYVTIPMMSFTAFSFITLLMLVSKRSE